MSRSILCLSLLLLLGLPRSVNAVVVPRDGSGSGSRAPLEPRPSKPEFRPSILVCLDAGRHVTMTKAGRIDIDDPRCRAIFERLGRPPLERIGRGPAAGGPLFARLDMSGRESDVEEVARELRATGAFRAVTPDWRIRLMLVPNDPYYVEQWYVQQTPNDADIDLIPAWDIQTGDPGLSIAILDTGVDLGHPDLAGKIAVNAGETPGNGLDDDANGLVDDVKGWDFGNGDSDANPEPFFDPSGLDAGFHGTFCAGLAGAATNNGEGIAGAGFNCRILPLKVSDSASDIPLTAVTAAFEYAVERGASIISMSFGARGDGVPEYFQALVDMATGAGVLCVAAAGNDTSDVPTYPAGCQDVLAVGATDDTGARAFFSNYGSWVDVSAPGQAIWSSICRNYEVDFTSQLFYLLFFGWDGVNPYMSGDGTSFACPLVAGVCGLVRSQFPAATPPEVIQHMVDTGDPVVYDLPMGPRVNAYEALLLPVSGVVDAAPRPSALALTAGPNPFSGSTRLSFDLPEAGPVRITLHDAAGRLVARLLDAPLAAGPHELAWDPARNGPSPAAAGVYYARVQAGRRAGAVRLVLTR